MEIRKLNNEDFKAALQALQETRNNISLGSSNIKVVNESPSMRVRRKSIDSKTEVQEQEDFVHSPKTVKSVSDRLVLQSPSVFYSPLLNRTARR